jgi:septation ring formation regulator EzrA
MRGYDPDCEDLAEGFIDDPPQRSRLLKAGYSQVELDQLRRQLAQRIQDAIEDWFSALEDEIVAKERQAHGHPADHR